MTPRPLAVLTAVSALAMTACSRTPEAVPSAPAPTSGIVLANIDPAVRPQDDFYRHINGQWLATTEIPADRSNYGAFTVLAD